MSSFIQFLTERFGAALVRQTSADARVKVRTRRNVRWARHCALTRSVSAAVGPVYVGPLSLHGTRYAEDGSGTYVFESPDSARGLLELEDWERPAALKAVWETLSVLHGAGIAQGCVRLDNIYFARETDACKFIYWGDGSAATPKMKWPDLFKTARSDEINFLAILRKLLPAVSLESIPGEDPRATIMRILSCLGQ